MRILVLLVSLALAAWPAGAASAPPPLVVTGPTTVLPLSRATYALTSLAPGEYTYNWTACGHAPIVAHGGQPVQTYSWNTPGPKTVAVDVFYPCGTYLGFGSLQVNVQGQLWTGSVQAWQPLQAFTLDPTRPTARGFVTLVNTGPSAAWHLDSGASWLRFTPSQGMGGGTVAVDIDASFLDPGRYTATSTLGSTFYQQQLQTTINVFPADPGKAPFGELSSPSEGSTVSGSVPVTGWVLDDVAVASTSIYYQNGSSSTPYSPSPMFVGDATRVDGSRPDAAAAYPDYPQSTQAGWGYLLLTNYLPNGGNGTFTLWALATDVGGAQHWLGPRTINCDNAHAVKPFGAIDTPAPGGTATGTDYRLWGWVLTPLPNQIPLDGSSIDVWIDGVNLGHPHYNQYRSDIAALFPGYANSTGAAGYLDFDTTQYRDGVHTIQWTATDDAANSDGIGSRYFTISNTGSSSPPPAPAHLVRAARAAVTPPSRVITVADPATAVVTVDVAAYLPAGGGTFTGYAVEADRFGPLPVGSSLDAATGAFAWQPGPAYAGSFAIEFWRTSAAGEIDSARLTFELGNVAPVTRRLHRPRRVLAPAAP